MLTGKRVLVSGASAGIGAAVAQVCAKAGALVVAASRSLQTDLSNAGHGVVASLQLDVADEASVLRCFEALDKLGGVDVLVNNAGCATFGPVEDLETRGMEETFRVNTFGAYLCSREAFRRMKPSGGRIINVGSVAASEDLPMNAVYGGSKAALQALTRSLNAEGKEHNVRATYLELGATYTPLWDGVVGFSAADMLTVDDVAEVIAFIASRPLRVRIDELSLLPPKKLL